MDGNLPCSDDYMCSNSEKAFILQLDGNLSCSDDSMSSSVSSIDTFEYFQDSDFYTTSEDSDYSTTDDINTVEDEEQIKVVLNHTNHSIPSCQTPSWYDAHHTTQTCNRTPVRKTIRRDDRLEKSSGLPTIAVSNLRSLIPKIRNFARDIKEREISLALLTEVWEKKQKKKHIFEIDKLLYMEGLKYISTTRPSNKRGGGAAIVADLSKFSLEKLDVTIPHNLEIVWGMLRPKSETKSGIREIIAVSFYSPPRSPKKNKLLDHILTTVHLLLSKYPNAGLVIGADKNDLNIASLITGIPRIKQLVTKVTYKNKILDIILTNLHLFYQIPVIIPPVKPDNPTRGVPSDHSIPVASPLTSAYQNTREYKVSYVRPLPESGIVEFEQWMNSLEWQPMLETSSPSDQVEILENTFETKMQTIFPLKKVKISSDDKPFITAELKKLDRKIKRIYSKSGKTDRYDILKKSYDLKYKKAARKYIEKNVADLKYENPGKAYSTLKKMGAAPGDCNDEGSFSLQNHLDRNLTTEQCVEEIADHFARISQEYPPLDVARLPPDVQLKVKQPANPQDLPEVSAEEVLMKIKKSKIPKSSVPGDLPKKLVQACAQNLSTPVALILKKIVTSCEWPKQWRTEYGVPLQKVSNPENEDQLRIISLTSFFSKISESFVIDWLMEYVGELIDWGQYGGLKGSSITHYLIELTNFVLYNQDLKNPRAVLAMMIDFSKAFNRQNHNTLIKILSDMGVPGWLLRVVMAFLTDRELILRYKGTSSGRKTLPGGSPQGTRLGMFLFLILINFAGFDNSDLVKDIGTHITQPMKDRKPLVRAHMKYIDDMTYTNSVQLKKCLKVNSDQNVPRPVAYHDRTGHHLPDCESEIHEQVEKLKIFVQDHEMIINEDKSKVMLFNTSRVYDFMPKVTFDESSYLEVVEEMKLLGIIIQSNMKWYSNTQNLCKKGYTRLWMLRNLKKHGACQADLLDVYIKQCRCMLELAVPVWNPAISKSEISQIERVQKTALAVILGKNYNSYEEALDVLKLSSLEDRRLEICKTFARKSQQHEKFQNWYTYSDEPSVETFKPVPYRTLRYKKSPLPYLTDLLNED